MEPIAVWVRKNGEWAVIHRCRRCGQLSSNRIAADDNPMELISESIPLQSDSEAKPHRQTVFYRILYTPEIDTANRFILSPQGSRRPFKTLSAVPVHRRYIHHWTGTIDLQKLYSIISPARCTLTPDAAASLHITSFLKVAFRPKGLYITGTRPYDIKRTPRKLHLPEGPHCAQWAQLLFLYII